MVQVMLSEILVKVVSPPRVSLWLRQLLMPLSSMVNRERYVLNESNG
jgi:hypothetical protein